MSDAEEEQLFKLSGTSGKVGEVLDGAVREPTKSFSASFTANPEAVVASSLPEIVAVDQQVLMPSELDDASISAGRTLFDDLLGQRIAKVKRVSADISIQLDALAGHRKE